MKELLVATNNNHKLEEMKEIFNSLSFDVKLISPKDFNDHTEPIEDGLTFKDNAYIKAKYYYDKYHLPTIADDSGIYIKYFNNYPGVHSSRFLKTNDNNERNLKILDLMKNVKDRECIFNCWLCFIDDKGNVKYYSGTLEGEISKEAKGDFGFGYDPIFFLKEYNKTNAELTNYGKNKISHRFKVLKDFVNDVNK